MNDLVRGFVVGFAVNALVVAALALFLTGAASAQTCTRIGNQVWCQGDGSRVVCTDVGNGQTWCR